MIEGKNMIAGDGGLKQRMIGILRGNSTYITRETKTGNKETFYNMSNDGNLTEVLSVSLH